MNNIIRRVTTAALLVALTGSGVVFVGGDLSAQAQVGRPFRNRDQVQRILERLEVRTDSFRRSLDDALDRSRFNGSQREDNINALARNFERQTDRLRDDYSDGDRVRGGVRELLATGDQIDRIMRRGRYGRETERDWAAVRTELNRLQSFARY